MEIELLPDSKSGLRKLERVAKRLAMHYRCAVRFTLNGKGRIGKPPMAERRPGARCVSAHGSFRRHKWNYSGKCARCHKAQSECPPQVVRDADSARAKRRMEKKPTRGAI